MSEIAEWNKWYQKTIPDAPELIISQAEKTFFQNQFYLRVPVAGSTGMVYFGKVKNLEVVFIRLNPIKQPISYPFTGDYEIIDLNKFSYTRLTYINGMAGQIYKSLSKDVAVKDGSLSVQTNSWFSQFLYCLSHYIVAVPAKINGEWTGCWVVGGGSSENEVLQPEGGDWGGGGTSSIDWTSFLVSINPSLTGPDPIPQAGNGTWVPYTPPAYTPPPSACSEPYDYLSGVQTIPLYYDFSNEIPFFWTYTGDNNETFTDPDPNENPDFQFMPNDNYETIYPRFTEMVKNLKTFVVNNPSVLSALQMWSGLSKQYILNHLTYGQGVIIKIEEMAGRFGFYNRTNGVSTIHLNAGEVRDLETTQLASTKQALSFLLAVTILHEFCHYGTAASNKSEGVFEFGNLFEKKVFNVIVTDNNAGDVVIKFSKYF